MSAILALIFTTAFCFYVLRKERPLQREFSPALWIPTLWMMRCATRSIDYWLSGQGVSLTTLDSTVTLSEHGDPIFITVLTVAALFVLARRPIQWPELFRDNLWLFLFFAYISLSCLWASQPYVSFKRTTRVFGDLSMALMVMTEGRPMLALITVIRRTAIFFIPFSILVCKYFAQFGRLQSKNWDEPDMWIGVSVHKNSLTAFLMVAALCFIWNMLRARRDGRPLAKLPGPRWLSVDLLYLAMAAFLMLDHRSRSSTALMSLAAACLLLLILENSGADYRRFRSWVFRFALVCLVVQGLCLLLAGESVYTLLIQLQGKQATLTGRTDYWPVLIQFGLQHPILGAGFDSFWTQSITDYFLQISIWGYIPESHNGYIETFVNLGFVGLGFLLVVIFKALASAWRNLSFDFPHSELRLMLLLAILMHNIAEASFPRENHALWLLFLMLALDVRTASFTAGAEDAQAPEEAAIAQDATAAAQAEIPDGSQSPVALGPADE